MKYIKQVNDLKAKKVIETEITLTELKKSVKYTDGDTNAKEELLEKVQPENILCASIELYRSFYKNGIDEIYKVEVKCILKKDHSEKDLKNFLQSLNFTYDCGFGYQQLFGMVWLKDGSWLERSEYDGSENWEHKTCPEIPKELL